jgi:hypothetical protein
MTLKLHKVAQLRRVELTSRAENKTKTRHSREGGCRKTTALDIVGQISRGTRRDLTVKVRLSLWVAASARRGIYLPLG